MKSINLRKLLVLFVVLLITTSAFSQLSGPIATERPTQSIGSLVLPTNSFQLEQGFTYAQDSLTLDGFFRFGVSKIAELRIFTYYDSPMVTYGAKVNVLQDKNYRPGIAFKADLTGGSVTDYRIAIMQKLSDTFSATVNFGVVNNHKGYGILAIGYSFADRFSAYIEGYFEDAYGQFNAGATYMVNSETQVDLNAGLYDFNDFYVTAGFARRIRFKDPESN